MAAPPRTYPHAGVNWDSLAVLDNMDSLQALAADGGYNFSVLNLATSLDELFSKIELIVGELMSITVRTNGISSAVTSTDSNLGNAWANVTSAIENFDTKFEQIVTEIRTLADNYIQSTIDNEVAAATNTDSIAESISSISSKLDALFQ